jgi:hypothetical protein
VISIQNLNKRIIKYMDVLDIQSQFRHLTHNGVALNVEERYPLIINHSSRLQIELALTEMVSSHTGYEEIVFWGKITGTIRDYYIIMGINFVDKYEFPEKGFFWATS